MFSKEVGVVFLLTSKEATVKKVMDLREQIREILSQVHKLEIQTRKSHITLVSTSKYPRTTMVKAVEDFSESRKTLAKCHETLEKLFKKLYDANCEYQDAHGMEIPA